MLLNFAVKNYRSFKDSMSLNMVAGGYKRFPGHVAEVAGRQILRSAFIFGANAGGKSNLVSAIDFLASVVEGGLGRVSLDKSYFRLGKEVDDVGVFQVDFASTDSTYSYGLAVSYSKAMIVGEWLSVPAQDGGEKYVFLREVDASGRTRVKTDFDLSENAAARYQVYCDDFVNSAMGSVAFLSDVSRRVVNGSNEPVFTHILRAREWFYRLIVIFPSSTYAGMIGYLKDTDMRLSLGELLRHFDTGIERLDAKDVEPDKVLAGLPPHARERRKAMLIQQLTDGRNSGGVKFDFGDSSYLVNFKNGELTMKKLVANHGNKYELFEREDESDGTRRLYDLLPLNRIFRNDYVVVIDELDRSLHTQATLEFIRLFFDASAGRRSQLIATTHDHEVMSLDRLRQDEVWFVERGDGHASRLYSLSQFKPRFDKDAEKEYMLGRYGAVPLFRMLNNRESSAS